VLRGKGGVGKRMKEKVGKRGDSPRGEGVLRRKGNPGTELVRKWGMRLLFSLGDEEGRGRGGWVGFG